MLFNNLAIMKLRSPFSPVKAKRQLKSTAMWIFSSAKATKWLITKCSLIYILELALNMKLLYWLLSIISSQSGIFKQIVGSLNAVLNTANC